MSIVKCKGTVLSKKVAEVYTAVAQIISLDLPEMESETFEADTLDNPDAGVPYEPTGRTEGGSTGGELFLDPALAGHLALLALLTTPAKADWQITFADTAATKWPFTGAGFKLGGKLALNDGLKATFSIKLDKLPTFTAA